MTAKKRTHQAGTTEIHQSPFEQITNLENEQEQRVAEASLRCDVEQKDAEKAAATKEKEQEDHIRTQANQALKEYARTEPANILKEADQQTADALQEMEKHVTKQLPKVAEKVVAPLLEGSLFTHVS